MKFVDHELVEGDDVRKKGRLVNGEHLMHEKGLGRGIHRSRRWVGRVDL